MGSFDTSGMVFFMLIGFFTFIAAVTIGIPWLGYYLWTHLHWVSQ